MDVLSIDGLTRRFGKIIANDDVHLSVLGGQVVGLLGHNGAGKTTLVSQVLGLLRPDAGRIRVLDCDAVAQPGRARQLVSLQPQAQAPIDGLTPRQAISIAARMRGATSGQSRRAVHALAQELDIERWLDQRALPEGHGLSGGVRRLTSFAMAVAAPTPLVVLDEPTNDIDPARRRLLWEAVRRRADQGCGVLLVTHNVVEAERVFDRVVVMNRGQVVADGTPSSLLGDHDNALRLELHMVVGREVVDQELDGSPFRADQIKAGQMRQIGHKLMVGMTPDQAGAGVQWATRLREHHLIESFSVSPASLEDAYLSLTATGGSTPVGTNDSTET